MGDLDPYTGETDHQGAQRQPNDRMVIALDFGKLIGHRENWRKGKKKHQDEKPCNRSAPIKPECKGLRCSHVYRNSSVLSLEIGLRNDFKGLFLRSLRPNVDDLLPPMQVDVSDKRRMTSSFRPGPVGG